MTNGLVTMFEHGSRSYKVVYGDVLYVSNVFKENLMFRKNHPVLLEITYGTKNGVNRDVSLFETFYRRYFMNDALLKFEKREKERCGAYALSLCGGALLCVIPLMINPASIFSNIILIMGGLIFATGLLFGYRALGAEKHCASCAESLISNEFMASRSMTKRIFKVYCTDQVAIVEFGLATAISQRRTKLYRDIPGVYLTDELLFIQGLTWVARFQMSDEQFGKICSLFEEKCADRFYNWKSKSNQTSG